MCLARQSGAHILGRDVAAVSFRIGPSGQINAVDQTNDILDIECQQSTRA